MQRRTLSLGLACSLAAAVLSGCHTVPSAESAYPPDPLLQSKKPLERNGAPGASMLAAAEPTPPPLPGTALAAASPARGHGASASQADRIQAHTVSYPKQPTIAVPAVRSSVPLEPLGQQTVERPAAEMYGHSADYSWLQGVLDKHYQGHFDLRFCDLSIDHDCGGKVTLEDDPRLAQFHDGDVVRIEGSVVPNLDPLARPTWNHFPHYRITEIRLVQRKS